MKIDLALPNDPSQASPNGDPGAMEPQYPSLTVTGDAAAQLMANHQPGDEFQAEVTVRVIGGDEGSVDLEVVDIDTGEEAAEAPEATGADALDEYLAAKGPNGAMVAAQ